LVNFQVYTRANADAILWPDSEDGLYACNYLIPFLRNGIEPFIKNIHHTEFNIIQVDHTIFPVTITDFDIRNSYTCSPYNHYISYGGYEEVHRLNNPPVERVIQFLLIPMAAYLKGNYFDQVVFVNNWLLSTNLYPALSESLITTLADALPQIYPDRAVVCRSGDPYRNARLFNTLTSRGYKMVLSRQVWYMDPLEASHTRQFKEDQRVLRRHPYEIIYGKDMDDGHFQQAVRLYNMLYIDKYSPYNPQFTPEFFKVARDKNLLHFRALTRNGKMDGIMGFFVRNGLMTQPVFGYDTSMPQETGLYRLLTLVTLQEGARLGLTIHASAGVGPFKKLRGGRSTFEYNAVFDRHLPASRQIPWTVMKWIADQAAPYFKKNNF
jgi:hypothetical protein